MLSDDTMGMSAPIINPEQLYAAYADSVVMKYEREDTRELLENYIRAHKTPLQHVSEWDQGRSEQATRETAIALSRRGITDPKLLGQLTGMLDFIGMDIDNVKELCASVIADEPGLYNTRSSTNNSQSTLGQRFLAMALLEKADPARHGTIMQDAGNLGYAMKETVNVWTNFLVNAGRRQARATRTHHKFNDLAMGATRQQISQFGKKLSEKLAEGGILKVEHGYNLTGILREAADEAGIGGFAAKSFPTRSSTAITGDYQVVTDKGHPRKTAKPVSNLFARILA